jgi:hypothetical protein
MAYFIHKAQQYYRDSVCSSLLLVYKVIAVVLVNKGGMQHAAKGSPRQQVWDGGKLRPVSREYVLDMTLETMNELTLQRYRTVRIVGWREVSCFLGQRAPLQHTMSDNGGLTYGKGADFFRASEQGRASYTLWVS